VTAVEQSTPRIRRGIIARASLRTRLLLAVFGGAILPLALLGFWLARSSERSGEVLLARRLDEALGRIATEMVPPWTRVRSSVLAVAESREIQDALRANPPAVGDSTLRLSASPTLTDGAARPLWIIHGSGHRIRIVPARDSVIQSPAPALLVRLPVHDVRSGVRNGAIETLVAASELIPPGVGGAAGVGSVVGAFDPATGASLLPLPFEPARLARGRFSWEREEWLARFQSIAEPSIVLALAAPLTPYTQPFQHVARDGAIALGIVSLLGFLVVALLTRRFTRSLAELAGAAHAVARGDLEQRVSESADDEVGAVARAFNAMTGDLRRTLDALARQRGLASVGEFAASMAHEVRNPLTAIRIGLQNLEEDVMEPAQRNALAGMLRQVQRLEATVAGSLRVARGGRMALEPVDLRLPLQAAWQSARPEFEAHGGTLAPLDGDQPPVLLRADPAALEQLFLNLLLNAAQALDAGGSAACEVRRSERQVEIRIRDTGRGIDPDRVPTIFEPMVSTRADGTGLGLTIARRIAEAHGGQIEIESSGSVGTTAVVTLPCLPVATSSKLTLDTT
jgi:signal transduction histidine kinase